MPMDAQIYSAVVDVFDHVFSDPGIPFSQAVLQLQRLGVVRYHVDYAGHTVTAYVAGPSDNVVVVAMPIALSRRRDEWSKDGVEEAIRLAQKGEVNYWEFSHRITAAGVSSYWVHFEGEKVIYLGEKGDWHLQYFPKGLPNSDDTHQVAEQDVQLQA